MENRNFETEVLTRLTVIETKLDDYNRIKEKSDETYSLSKENENFIEEIEEELEIEEVE